MPFKHPSQLKSYFYPLPLSTPRIHQTEPPPKNDQKSSPQKKQKKHQTNKNNTILTTTFSGVSNILILSSGSKLFSSETYGVTVPFGCIGAMLTRRPEPGNIKIKLLKKTHIKKKKNPSQSVSCMINPS